MKPIGFVIRLVVFTVWLVPVAAYGDPVSSTTLRITGRSAEFDWTDPFVGFDLIGSNFELDLVSNPGRSPGFRLSRGTVNPSVHGSSDTAWGLFRVGGRVWDTRAGGAWTFEYRIEAPDVAPVFGEGLVHIVFPFRFTASLTGSDFSYDFVGQGSGGWLTNNTMGFTRYGTFVFQDAAPIPEPSTMALLAGALAVARRRAHRSSRDRLTAAGVAPNERL